MSNLMLFQYHQKQVRVIRDDNDEPWFVAKDVCNVLDISWKGKTTLTKIKNEWKGYTEIPDTLGIPQRTTIINEPALYKLSFRSNKPEAEDFTDWLAEDVLPQIRKTGQYSIQQEEPEMPGEKRGSFYYTRDYVYLRNTKDECIEDLWKMLGERDDALCLRDKYEAMLEAENKQLKAENRQLEIEVRYFKGLAG